MAIQFRTVMLTVAAILFCVHHIPGASVPKKGPRKCVSLHELDMVGDEQMFLYDRINNDALEKVFGAEFPDGLGILGSDCTTEHVINPSKVKPTFDLDTGIIFFDYPPPPPKPVFEQGPTPLAFIDKNVWLPIGDNQARVFVTELIELPYAFLVDRRIRKLQHLAPAHIPGYRLVMQLELNNSTLRYRTCKGDKTLSCELDEWGNVTLSKRDAHLVSGIQFDQKQDESEEVDTQEDNVDGPLKIEVNLEAELIALREK